MECPMVSVLTGAMHSLLVKLTALLESVDQRSTSMQQEITDLKGELSTANGHLQAFGLMRESPTLQAKQWMRQLRETVYDAEDWLDDVVRQTDREVHNHARGMKRLVQKAKKMGSSNEILSMIRYFSARVKAANNRLKRYEIDSTSSSGGVVDPTGSSSVAADSKLASPLVEVASLVGIDGPRDELLSLLGGEGNQLKVISMVGSGGLGKTSIAKQVYGKLQQQFKCRAFVYAGRTTSVKTVLMNIHSQISRQQHDGIESWDERHLIHRLKEFLKHKKYLVVIIDVRSSCVWQVIRGALPENNVGSRIVLTTHSYELAKSSCILPDDQIYEVKPLSAADSKTLLLGRIFDSKRKCQKLEEDVLKRCCGMPLAIIVMAGVLAGTREVAEQRQLVEKYIISEECFETEEMNKILHLGYMALPNHLKSCFLYLSVYPEGYVIKKGRMIRRWIAEGFICERGEQSLLEIAESYLDELVNRSLIQPVATDHDGQEIGYIVHEMIHELIVSLSVEENFVTVPLPCQWIPPNMIRRLSVQYKEVTSTMPSAAILSHVRSLTIFGHDQGIQDPSLFRYLRVLDLEDTDNLENYHLKNIGKLFQLKYLGLGGKGITNLSEEIGALEYMETLDIRRTNIRKLPTATIPLKLRHLLVSEVGLPNAVAGMQDLHELSMVNVTSSSSTKLAELGELKNLKILGVKWCFDNGNRTRETEENLVAALGMPSLRFLSLDTNNNSSLDFLVDSWSPPEFLEMFKLRTFHYYFPSVPQSMHRLHTLTYLEIGIAQVGEAELEVLRGLLALIVLKLRSGASSGKEMCIISNNGFQCLKEFWFMRHDGGIGGLTFTEGALPKLLKLGLQCHVWGSKSLHGDFNFGIEHLSHLKQIHINLDCEGAGVSEVEDAEDAIRKAVNIQPTCEFEFTTQRGGKMIQCTFKCNSDVSQSGKSVITAVFRSSSGCFLAALAQRLNQAIDDDDEFLAALACQEAMKFALKEGFKRVCFASACQQLVDKMNSVKTPKCPYYGIIEDNKKLKGHFESVSVEYRRSTVEADEVAKHARLIQGEHQTWTTYPPDFLKRHADVIAKQNQWPYY